MASALSLFRRWVVDYFNRHDDEAARSFATPAYTLRIGDAVLAGRDESWLPAVAEQMRLFPGLGMTVHQTLAGDGWVAAWFSEHGASKGRVASWSGVALYFSDGERLTGCVAQEDYLTRRRQLRSGLADAVDPPAPAPWDVEVQPRNASAEEAVRRWLEGDWPPAEAAVRCDDEHITRTPLRFQVRRSELDVLKSSGSDVAFHALQHGVYLGGFEGVSCDGADAHMHVNGLVRVEGGRVVSGRLIRDRAGLRAALQKGASA